MRDYEYEQKYGELHFRKKDCRIVNCLLCAKSRAQILRLKISRLPECYPSVYVFELDFNHHIASHPVPVIPFT